MLDILEVSGAAHATGITNHNRNTLRVCFCGVCLCSGGCVCLCVEMGCFTSQIQIQGLGLVNECTAVFGHVDDGLKGIQPFEGEHHIIYIRSTHTMCAAHCVQPLLLQTHTFILISHTVLYSSLRWSGMPAMRWMDPLSAIISFLISLVHKPSSIKSCGRVVRTHSHTCTRPETPRNSNQGCK